MIGALRKLLFLLLLGFVAIATVGVAQPASKFRGAEGGNAGLGRFRITVTVPLTEERDRVIGDLAAIYHARVEPYREEGFDGFIASMSIAAARLLSSDPRVVLVEEVAESALVPSEIEPRGTASRADAAQLTPVTNAGGDTWTTGTYAYDGSGNIKSIGTADTFVYDKFGRVVSGTAGAGHQQNYTYDRYGNLNTITTVVTGQSDSVTSLSPQSSNNRTSLGTYDLNGNMTSYQPIDQFWYDGAGMITESKVDNVRNLYVYTPNDERIATIRVNLNGSTYTEISSEWTLRDASGKSLRRLVRQGPAATGTWRWVEDYVYRDGTLLASDMPGSPRRMFYHLDHLGTPRLITGEGGPEIASHTYYPFGKEATDDLQDAERLKFTGHERDAASLDYMHARYYNPKWGRFLSVDPGRADAQKPQSWNRYTYTMNNPMRLVDPDGKEPLDPALLQFFRAAFGGRDFTNVNVHSDVPLPGVGLTLGNQVFLDSPNWDARNPTGLGSLAHELDHNIEQGQTGVLSFMDQYGSDVASNRRSGMSFSNAYVNASSEQSARVVDNHVVAFLSDPKNRDIATALQKGNALNAKQLARVKNELAPILRQQDANIRVECADSARSNCRAILEPVPVK
jgi:RHS repeat-associated protein